MSAIDQRWTVVGRMDNAAVYMAEPRILVIVPHEGCIDDEMTAHASLAFQRKYWATEECSGVTIVLMDLIAHQTKGARRAYQSEEHVDLQRTNGFALVTSSVFGRAVASVFMGLARPPVPTRLFPNVALALGWARERNGEAVGR